LGKTAQIYEGKSYQTNLITFYNRRTLYVDVGRTVDVVYLVFSRVFDTVSHSLLLEKLGRYRLDEQCARQVEN